MREFIVEADGGSRGNPGPAGYGSVVIDAATGQTLAERAGYIGIATNNVAEYRGLVAGLTAARELDPTARVRVRMDSKLVVEQMSGRWKIKHPDMKPLAAEAARVFPPAQVTYEWIPREHNKHADRLANEAMDAGRRGEQWSPSTSTAELDAAATRSALPEPPGPPGDATAGAAKARAALAPRKGRGAVTSAAPPPAGGLATPSGPPSEADPGGEAAKARAALAGAGSSPVSSEASGTGARHPGRGAVTSAAPPPAGGLATPSGPPSQTDPGGEAANARAALAGAGSSPVSSEAPGTGAPHPGRGAVTSAAPPPAGGLATPSGPPSQADPGGEAAKAGADVRAAGNVATAPTGAPAPTVGWGAAPDMGAPATFVLLRHGETLLTPQKRFSGSGGSDPSLSDVGREQAERVAAALAARGTIEAIVSSPLARTRQTAGAVAARLGLDVVIEDGLRETDFGAWEGLTFGEVRERYPDDLNAWLASPKAEPTGGGESFAATARRLATTRDKLIASYAGRTVLLVTHVTPIKTLVRLAIGAPPESLFRMELSAASLSAVAYYADGNASVRLFNDTSHLR